MLWAIVAAIGQVGQHSRHTLATLGHEGLVVRVLRSWCIVVTFVKLAVLVPGDLHLFEVRIRDWQQAPHSPEERRRGRSRVRQEGRLRGANLAHGVGGDGAFEGRQRSGAQGVALGI